MNLKCYVVRQLRIPIIDQFFLIHGLGEKQKINNERVFYTFISMTTGIIFKKIEIFKFERFLIVYKRTLAQDVGKH